MRGHVFRRCWCRDPQTGRPYRKGGCPNGYVGEFGEHLSMSSSSGRAFTGTGMSMSSNSTQHVKAARDLSGGSRTDGPVGQPAAARV